MADLSKHTFLRLTMNLLAAAIALLLAGTAAPAEDPPLVRVVQVTDPAVLDGGQCEPGALRRMVQRGLQEVTGCPDEAEAWGRFLRPDDVVGLKISTERAPELQTHPELVQAVVESLSAAGVTRDRIVVWDRSAETLARAGWTLGTAPDGLQVVASEGAGALGYEDIYALFWSPLGAPEPHQARLSRVLTQRITRLVNLPVLRHDPSVGLAFSLHNLSQGSVETCDPVQATRPVEFLPAVFGHPLVQRPLTLTIGDCLRPQYDQGDTPNPALRWEANSLLFSVCQPAADAVARALLNQARQSRSLAPLACGDPAKDYLAATAKAGLGTADLSRIDWRRLTL